MPAMDDAKMVVVIWLDGKNQVQDVYSDSSMLKRIGILECCKQDMIDAARS
jgi:hypothetical protein